MLNEQVMGMLQNNAGNPEIVKRIAEENGLSQTEIAQALKIPEEAAARYAPAEKPEAGLSIQNPGADMNMAPVGNEIPSVSNAAPQLPTASLAAQAPSVSGQMVSAMQKPMAVPPEPVAAEKPGSLPSQMKPQTMMEGKPTMTSRRPGGNPSLPRVPAFERGRQNLENERAFVDAFNRLRARGDLL